MAKYILLTLLPEVPVSSTDFRLGLSDAKLELYDIRNAGLGESPSKQLLTTVIFPHDDGDGIIHAGPPFFNSAFDESYLSLKIEVNPQSPEYPNNKGVDLYAVLYDSQGEVIIEKVINYNFPLLESSTSTTDPNITDDNNKCPDPTTNEFDNKGKNRKETRGYLKIPVSGIGVAALFREDGNAPDYTILYNHVLNVLSNDNLNGATAAGLIGNLTLDQCEHVARELSWNRFYNRAPNPKKKNVKKLYKWSVGNDGSLNESQNATENREAFESELEKHYGQPESQAQRLKQSIWAIVCALWASNESSGATDILFRFPIQLPNLGSREINISGVTSGTLSVPPEYFYAHGVDIPVNIERETRYKQIKTLEQDVLLNLFQQAEENEIADLSGTAINHFQALRLLRALDNERPSLPQIDASTNSDIQPLLNSWSSFNGADSYDFWNNITNGSSESEGHSDLVIFLLTEGNTLLTAELDTQANDISTIANATSANLTLWYSTVFPTEGSDAAIGFLPPGTTLERGKYFAIYTADFFGNLSAVSTDYSIDITLHTPPVFSTHEGPIQKFFNDLPSLSDIDDPSITEPIIESCFLGDTCGQDWLRKKVEIFSKLYTLIDIPTLKEDPNDPISPPSALAYSVMETLYALGITGIAQVQNMSEEDFQTCVAQTVITNDIAVEIYSNFNFQPEVIADDFIPINPGDLVNCIPPDYLSKTGKYAYLQDMLAFEIGDNTVSDLLEDSRGISFDELLVSPENADLEIPKIDVVTEMLEEIICKPVGTGGTGVNWNPDDFARKFCVISSLPAQQIKSNFRDLATPIPNNTISILTSELGNNFSSYVGIKNDWVDICKHVGGEIANGNIISVEDLKTILTNISQFQAATDILNYINDLQAINNSQYATDSVDFLYTLSQLPSNPIIEFIAYLVQSLNQTTTQSIGIGNSNSQSSTVYLPSSVTGKNSCAYEELAVSTKDACKLPYHQPLEVSKTYLNVLGMSRFELAQKFSSQIHGFPYDLDNAPTEHKSYLHRLPVNHKRTLEYLGISPQEYTLFYEEVPFYTGGNSTFHELLGYDDIADLVNYTNLEEFLKKNCLDCCDFDCWLDSGFSININDADGVLVDLNCTDCDAHQYQIDVTAGGTSSAVLINTRLWHLTLLIRFARQVKKAGISCYSCRDLVLISEKLNWINYDANGLNVTINAQFIEQFTALDMLRKEFGICFKCSSEDRNEIFLTDLLEGPTGANWNAVLTCFTEKILEKCNAGKAPNMCRGPQFIKLLIEHIEVLANLAGFRSDADDFYKWYYQFTNIIRFTQVLHRVCDSKFTVGQLQFIFTTEAQPAGDDPYPQQTKNEAIEYPFNLADNSDDFDLDSLREKLLDIHLEEAEITDWTWQKIDASLNADFGQTGTAFLDMGKQFFPEILETLGYTISNAELQFQTPLAQNDTALLMWNTGNVNPFFYIPGFLTCKIPLKSADVIQKLQTVRQLNTQEATAVQNLFFAPRLVLSPFAAFFTNFTEALSILIETEEEQTRWAFFQKSFALFRRKCDVISQHFTEQLSESLGIAALDERVSRKILAHVYADDNAALSPWEDDLGVSPAVTFPNKIHAGAFTALCGLTGTGLKGTFKDVDGNVLWREIRADMTAYGVSENLTDNPVPTVVPNLNFIPQNSPLIGVIRNGNALTNGSPSKILGGAQGYTATYKGVLYLTETGQYTFRAGAPTGFGEIPDFEQAKHSQWQLTLKRGNKTWIVLDNDWEAPDTPGDCSMEMNLKRGAYDICFNFTQPEPSLQNTEDGCPQPTGWQIKWTMPFQSEWHSIPIAHLYHKESFGDLSDNIQVIQNTASDYLKSQYQPSISGIRRTAIRVFGAGLLMHGSQISAEPVSDSGTSEIDYLLSNRDRFSGISHYKDAGIWKTHLAGFDLNLLPVLDNYCPPYAVADKRVEPSTQRIQALFQWFEQLWEFNNLKTEAAEKGLNNVWLLWHECAENHQDLAGHLQKYLGVGFDKTALVTNFYSGLTLSGNDLLNEEWTIRVWEALKCIEAWMCNFVPASFQDVKPAEWVNIDFNSTGNENLVSFITEGFKHSQIDKFKDLEAINDSIRTKSNLALRCYYTNQKNANLALDEILLTDVAVGSCETASRLDMAIEMTQTFLHRISLGIEQAAGKRGFIFNKKEELEWNNRLSSFKIWQICKFRSCYPENFAIHGILKEDSKSSGFRFFRENLKKDVLTVPVSGGVTKITGIKAPSFSTLMPLQESIPSVIPESTPVLAAQAINSGVKNWESTDRKNELNFWLETVGNLQIPYVRVAAASLPYAGIQYKCQDNSCYNSCEEDTYHPVTEYYFWIINSKHYAKIEQSYKDWDNTNNSQLQLLYMQDKSVSFLAWSKIENGHAGAVQWSSTGIKAAAADIELVYRGRYGDSLWIEAINGTTELVPIPDPNNASNPIEGTDIIPSFRFDLVTETVITLPKIGEKLPALIDLKDNPYYFLYHNLGAPRFPKSLHGTVYSAVKQLQSNCEYKGAKAWLDYVLNALQTDNHWTNDTDTTSVKRKLLLLTYVENLLTWSKHLQDSNSKESLNQAKMILSLAGKILGKRPKNVKTEQTDVLSLSDFTPQYPGMNPKLLCLYDDYFTQREFLAHCLNTAGQQCYSLTEVNLNSACLPIDCCSPRKDCVPESPYRFMYLIGRAKEYAGTLSGLGNSLQAAMEKGDQERLTFLREVQSNELVYLNVETRKNLVREAHFQVEALEKTLEITQTRLVHYQNLINVGLIAQEQDYKSLTKDAMIAQAASQALNATAQFVVLVPEGFIGTTTSDVGGGTKTASSLQGAAAVASTIGGILQTRASLKNYDAGNFRREQEWIHQRNTLTIEIEQIKNQLIAAQLRLLNSETDLNNYQIQIDHSNQTLKYLRDKFTNQELYQWQEKELSQLYYSLFECAMQTAYQAEKAYNIERCYSNEQFINSSIWNNNHRGLLAGEQLSAALRHMEKRYLDTNHKQHELTKSISIRKEIPRAYLMVRYSGASLIKIDEDLFAFDHPSHYCRVIKSISLTIPCVVGPYVNVNAGLQLRSSFVRVNPKILPVSCSDKENKDGYNRRKDDSRFVFVPNGKDVLATSKAVQDSGYHQLSFQDERKLSFEGAGVESEFCFALRQANNRFDTDTVRDIILDVSYLAKEGGMLYGQAASETVKHRLPGNGELLLNLQEQFPDNWYEMQSSNENSYKLELARKDFPFLSFDANLSVFQVEIFIETEGCHDCSVIDVYYQEPEDSDCIDCDDTLISACTVHGWRKNVFHGVVQKDFAITKDKASFGQFCFPEDLKIKDVFVLVSYEAELVGCSEIKSSCNSCS